jgi:cytochrome P450
MADIDSTTVPAPPDFAFDHFAPEMAENPFDTWATLQTKCPVAHTPTHGGFYVLSRYEDRT